MLRHGVVHTGPVVLALAVLLLTAAEPEAVRQELQRLRGTWVVVAAEQDGQPLDRIKGGKLILSDTSFAIHTASGVTLKGDYRIDPSQKPRHMDLDHQEGMLRDKTWKGIYEVEGDRLRLCYVAADSAQPRPDSFTTAADSDRLLVVLERVK
jgi:uncharacterized protein (TIGR03067 family)